MPAIRTTRKGAIRHYGIAQQDQPNRAEQRVMAMLDASTAPPTESDLPTWPHWAGCGAYAGQFELTAHGEITRMSPYLRERKAKAKSEG